ncbi:hypothetical protein [Streptomyces sp. NPDC058249]|uniref:hypothetical protein n=1 Tax=Streptomyces sp. NPDC058249 TaxID=3346403 RepID=UPI0036F04E54
MDELTELAVAGATALVTQMVSDGRAQVRDRLVAILTRGSGDEEVVQGELETARAELVAAREAGDARAADDVLVEWRNRLRRTPRADPEVAAELRSLLDELERAADEQPRGNVYNAIDGGMHHGSVVQAQSIGILTIGEPCR